MIKKILITVLLFTMLTISGCSSKNNSSELVIYATRHGETYFNLQGRVQGWSNTFLTDSGIEIAEYLGKGLSDVEFNKVYSSDLGRSIQTANIILSSKGQDNLDIITLPELREANYGSYEGGFNSDMATAMAEELGYKDASDFMTNSSNFFREGADALSVIDEYNKAESADEIVERMMVGLNRIIEENSDNGGNVLLVGHGMSISLLVEELLDGVTLDDHLGNASVTKIIYKDNSFTVESIGDMSYVEAGKLK